MGVTNPDEGTDTIVRYVLYTLIPLRVSYDVRVMIDIENPMNKFSISLQGGVHNNARGRCYKVYNIQMIWLDYITSLFQREGLRTSEEGGGVILHVEIISTCLSDA
jgi:hypothetical protein